MNEEAQEILEDIKGLNKKQLRAYVEFLIKRRIEKSKDFNEDNFIGYNLPINFRYPGLDITNKNSGFYVEYNTYYTGYIHDKVKLLYGRMRQDDNKMGSFGFYYYVNNHEFIYEYLDFIQKQYYEDDFSLIYQTFYFIRNYFGVLGKVERETISGLVLNNHGEYIEPTKQPSLIDFKHKGCGKCSEYAALMENILSFLGYNISYLMGTCNEELHAYNIILIDNGYYLLDASYCTSCYDIQYNYINAIPYIVALEDYTEDDLVEFIQDGTSISADNSYAMIINDNFYPVYKESKRIYRTLTRNSEEI